MAQKETLTRRVREEQSASAEEVRAAVEALSSAELNRLLRFAQMRIAVIGKASKGREGHDLLHEAMIKVLSGDRHWNKDVVTFVEFLYGAIRSISNNWCNTVNSDEASLESELTRENEDGTHTTPLLSVPSGEPSPEQTMIINQEVEHIQEQITRIRELIASRPLARQIIEERLEGMTGTEIQDTFGISKKQYETEMKWVRRTIRGDAARGRSNVWK